MAKNDNEFPSNSKSGRVAPIRPSTKVREEIVDAESKKRRVISPRAAGVRRKKSWAQSIAMALFGEGQGVGNYLINDILIPAAKDTIQEFFSSGLEMILFGERRSSRGRSKDRGERSNVSYGNIYKSRNESPYDPRSRSMRGAKFGLDEIFFRKGDEASEVLDGLCDQLEEYEEVTVAHFFELAGISGATWVHGKWGWKDLSKAYATYTRNGYAIIMPDPIELD